jgi:tryptophan 2,3-dioxygenase
LIFSFFFLIALFSPVGILFIESYADELPLLAWPRLLLDPIVEIEENFLLFRYFHARLVERMIGRRVGTGGSSGVGMLRNILFS